MDSLKCPICDLDALGGQVVNQDAYAFRCKRCGEFVIDSLLMMEFQAKVMMLSQNDQDLLPYLSAHTRQSVRAWLDGDNWRELARAHRTIPVPQKARRLLELLHSRSPHAGAPVRFDVSLDCPLADAGSVKEIEFLLTYLVDLEYLARGPTYDPLAYSITGKGWEHLEGQAADPSASPPPNAPPSAEEPALDALTKVLSREALLAQLDEALTPCGGDNLPISLAFVDLDNFKQVNDTLGHQAGDTILTAFGSLLNQVTARQGLIVGRYGGDEFLIVAPNWTPEKLQALASQIQRSVAEDPRLALSTEPKLGCSVGIGYAPSTDSQSATGLIERADRALYSAKRAGKGRVVIFSEQASSRSELVEVTFTFQGTPMLPRNTTVNVKRWKHHPSEDNLHFEAQIIEVPGGLIESDNVHVIGTLSVWEGKVSGTLISFRQAGKICEFRMAISRETYEAELLQSWKDA